MTKRTDGAAWRDATRACGAGRAARRWPWRSSLAAPRCSPAPAGARRDVQVGRRQGRRPLHRQDAAGGRQQGQRRAQQAGHPDQEDRSGAHARAAQRATRPRTSAQRQLAQAAGGDRPRATARCSPSYTSESEIDLARKRALQTIDNVRCSRRRPTATQLTKRKAGRSRRKKAELGDKPVPPALERELESIDAELARQADLIAQKKQRGRRRHREVRRRQAALARAASPPKAATAEPATSTRPEAPSPATAAKKK